MPNNMPQVGAIEDGFRFKGGDPGQSSSWQRVTSEAEGVATRPSKTAPQPQPGVLGRPAMPGTASRYAGPQSQSLTQKMRASRDVPMDVAKVAAPTVLGAVAPEAMLPGAIAQGVARGTGAVAGASYGGRKASEFGLPRWSGQVVGGVGGFFAPEAIEKMGGPLLSRVLRSMGRGGMEATGGAAGGAAGAASGSDLMRTMGSEQARVVAEKAAMGHPLSPAEEETLLQQVQRHYGPESGMETASSKAGKMYASRGTSFRPTNTQLEEMGGGEAAPTLKSKVTSRSSFGRQPEQIMAQPAATSRATPTATLSQKLWEGLPQEEAQAALAPEEHAAMEAEAGRPLSSDEAVAMNRARMESKMGTVKGEDIGAIREQHRAGLEQKGRR